ncbi:MAG: YifB family Mg chelatase-like AAA ATPase [Mycetocola sp.]
MAIARTWGVAVSGIGGTVVEVEADLGAQLPRFNIIGMADRSLAEAEDRVRQAALNAGFALPARRLTVNLAPAELPKHGTGFDLAIALAALATGGSVTGASIDRTVHIGELGLDGRVRPVGGVLPACIAAWAEGFRTVMVPRENAAEAQLADPGLVVVAVSSLVQAVAHYEGTHGASEMGEAADAARVPEPEPNDVGRALSRSGLLDFSDVYGQEDAIIAAQIAAAGGHHLSMTGPPGTGKSMIAERMADLLPDLDDTSARELSCIRSVSDDRPLSALVRRPPFVAPHHTTSAPALLGGGSSRIRPGAVTLASHGILFLDEAPEMNRNVLNALRQPLETGVIRIHRARGNVVYPARFQLVLASNPCPCGYADSSGHECLCSADILRRYSARLAGPLLDRIDVRVRVEAAQRQSATIRKSSAILRTEVKRAREIAVSRGGASEPRVNAGLSVAELDSPAWAIDGVARAQLDGALEAGRISMRGYDRVRRVSWTIADLAGHSRPTRDDVEQALYFRRAA